MLSIKEILKWSIEQFVQSEITSTPALDAEVLLAHVLSVGREYLVGHSDEIIDSRVMQNVIKRRINGEPVAYIIGKKEFWGMDFKVTKDTLIPRPETELIIETALKFFSDKESNFAILDLGTGSGCILISLLYEFKNARGVGVDLSEAALDVARENARGIDNIEFIQSNWFENLGDETFDLIVSNPPYISRDENLQKSVINFEPHSALFASDNGYKCYEDIAKKLPKFLKKSGKAIFEFGQGQAVVVSNIFASHGFIIEEIGKDLAGIERVIVVKMKTDCYS